MRDSRSQIESLKSDIRLLQGKLNKLQSRLGQIPHVNPYQHLMVEADEDIAPDEEGVCSVVWRLGKTPGYDDRELKKRESYKVKVYNHRKAPIWKDDRFHVAVDVWGDYYLIAGSDGDATFFLTGESGMYAASGKFQPYGEELQRYYASSTGYIRPLEDPKTGAPVFEMVWNYTENRIGGDKLVQAKRINGQWFIDVEPC